MVLVGGTSLQGQAGVVSHQVVKVAVLNCEPSKERMLLSFKLSSDPKKECAGHSQKKKKAINAGQVPGLLQTNYFSDSGREQGATDTWGAGNRAGGRSRQLDKILGLCVRADGLSRKESAVTVWLVSSVLLPSFLSGPWDQPAKLSFLWDPVEGPGRGVM